MRCRSIAPRLALAALLALFLAACTPEREVYRGLTQRDANEMVALLQRDSIAAKREEVAGGGYRITVAEGDFPRTVELLSAAGYPREPYRSLAEIFPGEGLIVTPFEQRARMTFALNQELSRTVAGIEGVTSARVHVVVPELDLRGQPQTRASASVVVHHGPGADPTELSGRIKLIIANAVQGLSYKDVSVSFFANARSGPRPEPGPAQAATRPAPEPSAPAEIPAAAEPPAPTRWVLWGSAGLLALVGLGLLGAPLLRRRG